MPYKDICRLSTIVTSVVTSFETTSCVLNSIPIVAFEPEGGLSRTFHLHYGIPNPELPEIICHLIDR